MMVAGLQPPDAGSIVLDGKPVDRLPPYRRDIGMVFQHYALFPHMTVRRNVAFPLEMRRVAAAETDRLVDDALALRGPGRLRRPPAAAALGRPAAARGPGPRHGLSARRCC